MTPVPAANTPVRAPAATPVFVTATPRGFTNPGQNQGVAFISVVGGLPGNPAEVTVQTAPYALCRIQFETVAGRVSTSPGLNLRAADAQGIVTWSWNIRTGTPHGEGRVTVTCAQESASAPIMVG